MRVNFLWFLLYFVLFALKYSSNIINSKFCFKLSNADMSISKETIYCQFETPGIANNPSLYCIRSFSRQKILTFVCSRNFCSSSCLKKMEINDMKLTHSDPNITTFLTYFKLIQAKPLIILI